MKALITVNIVVLLAVIGMTQANKGMHNKLEFFFVCLFLYLFVCFVSFCFFLQLKMNIKKNNNLCPQAKEQIKQINELGEGGDKRTITDSSLYQ